MVAGSRSSRWTFCTSTTASLSDTPGWRLNEIVTAGSWPRCVTVRGPIVGVRRATEYRDELARLRPHVEQGELGGVALVLGIELHDDPVLVRRRVDRRDLARAVGVVQRVL